MKRLEALFCWFLKTVCGHLDIFTGVCIAFPLFCVGAIAFFGEKGEDFLTVLALLITPFITQSIGSVYLYLEYKNNKEGEWKKFYIAFFSLTMAMSSGFHLAMWLFFSSDTAANLIYENKDSFSTICLYLIILQIFILILTAYWIRKPVNFDSFWKRKIILPDGTESGELVFKNIKEYSDDDVINSIIKGLRDFPFLSLVHFFAVFFSISYLFGLAFAFHDRATQPYALHKENLGAQPSKPLREIVKRILDNYQIQQILENSRSRQNLPVPSPVPGPDPEPICFYFEEEKAELETKILPEDRGLSVTEQRRNYKNKLNATALTTFVNKFPTSAHQQTRIRLIGRASEPSAKNTYLSNYELSQARIQVVRFEIAKKLFEKYSGKWANLDWILIPYSSESTSQGDEKKCSAMEEYDMESTKDKSKESIKDKNSGKRVVQAYIDSISDDPGSIQIENQIQNSQKQDWEKCDLMDYMYFSIYTITTTGYGDIKPVTTYSKLLVSLENFFEVFFLAGFLNILISLKDQNNKPVNKNNEPKN